MPQPLYTIVVGCGRLGSLLAEGLSQQNHSVVAVDRDPASFDNLSAEFGGFRIAGDASELSVLREAKVDRADCVLAVTNRDAINLMVTQVAREIFQVPTAIARVFDPERESLYREFGITTISPVQLSADQFLTTLKTAEARQS